MLTAVVTCLAAVFFVAASAKAASRAARDRLSGELISLGLPTPAARVATTALILLEYGLVACLLYPASRHEGLLVASLLLAAFAVFSAVEWARGGTSCNCFGSVAGDDGSPSARTVADLVLAVSCAPAALDLLPATSPGAVLLAAGLGLIGAAVVVLGPRLWRWWLIPARTMGAL